MKTDPKKGLVVFTAPFDTVLNIFNYPDPIPVKKGDMVVFKIRVKKPTELIFFGKPN